MWPEIIITALLSVVGHATPPSCPGIPPARYPFELAAGWTAMKVADGLTSPRGLVIDNGGRLLVVEKGSGISQHAVDINGCITSSRTLVSMSSLNHGIYLGIDGRTLYASSATDVFRWAYNPENGNTDGPPEIVVSGMASEDHVTRTLIIPAHRPDLLVVSHGSNSNLDYATSDPATARAIVKVFNVSMVPNGGYNYAHDGWNAGYGLRNEVGLAFDGNNMLWGVENSSDQLMRDVNGTLTDIHTDNPAEELNFLGDVTIPNDAWYGYPTCFTIWGPDASIVSPTDGHELDVGEQFVTAPNETFDDSTCAHISKPPRLSFQSHTAPLDAKFDSPKYDNLFVTMHGSWDRNPPVGYKLVAVPFTRIAQDGTYIPVAPANSKTGYFDVFYPPDEGQCSATTCARPVGLVFDAAGRLYMTSDTSGEVFMLSSGGPRSFT
ncbi:soluble quino protein glucose/sorbosone dehydrogenase [Hypoxylon sp. FL0543]|nr:soluble quino protein glucose/sorbosone dehydrogenase [Hypoxylon sp. FL0543]